MQLRAKSSLARSLSWPWWFVLPLGWLVAGGCQSDTADRPSAALDVRTALLAAKGLEALDTGRMTTVGAGRSMMPVFGDDTVVVISAIPYDELEPNMFAAYYSDDGRAVIHELIDEQPRGWLAKGLNNASVDAELITEQNLIGVVYAVLHTGAKD